MKSLLKYLIISFSVLFVFGSCEKNNTDFVLTSSKIEGLKPSMGIFYERLKIGYIDQVKSITSDSSILECQLISGLEVPKDSRFYLSENETDTILTVVLGDSKELLHSGDIYPLMVNERSLIDIVGSKFIDFIEQLSGSKQQDSILLELRRLNESLGN